MYAGTCHADDFSAAIRLAVNHDGDSDSTGSICGNIVGALLGIEGIGRKWAEGLEMANLVLDVAKDLCDDCPMEERGSYRDDVWFAKYGGAPFDTDLIAAYLEGGMNCVRLGGLSNLKYAQTYDIYWFRMNLNQQVLIHISRWGLLLRQPYKRE